MVNFKDFFYLHKSDRRILSAFLLVMGLALGGLFLLDGLTEKEAEADATETMNATETADSMAGGDSKKNKKGKNTPPMYFKQEEGRKAERFAFDPNTADSTQLLRLGLRPWQVRNIYKYRAAGGIYQTKEDFAQLYGLTLKEYRELEPYIHISDDYLPAARMVRRKSAERDTLRFPKKIAESEVVDLATADTALLRRVPGIGSYYAHEIVKYRERLGGFAHIDQLDEIEGFPQDAKRFFKIETPAVKKLNLNRLKENELKRHPYLNYYQAHAIVDYRRRNGRLNSLDDLRLLRDFPDEGLHRLAPYVEF